jgi:hypothetical protein
MMDNRSIYHSKLTRKISGKFLPAYPADSSNSHRHTGIRRTPSGISAPRGGSIPANIRSFMENGTS